MADNMPDLRKLVESLLWYHVTTCYRCRRPAPSEQADFAEWSIRAFLNYPIAIVCPDCQSPEERAELAIRAATSTYTLEGGRLIEHPMPTEDDDEDDEDNHRSA